MAFWRGFFGEQLLDDVATRVYGGASWGPTIRMLIVLLRYYPRGMGRRVAKVARRLARTGRLQ
jgi:hypothetical protein